MSTPLYYIIIHRKKHVLLGFLKIRVVVNNRHIYPLTNAAPVIIPVENDHPRIVITDGFHFTRPLELTFSEPSYLNLSVACAIDNGKLLTGSIVLGTLYMLGFVSGVLFMRLLSFLPIAWFLVYYYIRRRDFIRLEKA